MLDDAGRETLLVKPTWRGEVLAAGLRYLKVSHELKFDRYMEDGRMVELGVDGGSPVRLRCRRSGGGSVGILAPKAGTRGPNFGHREFGQAWLAPSGVCQAWLEPETWFLGQFGR